jgi:hypothetical protein
MATPRSVRARVSPAASATTARGSGSRGGGLSTSGRARVTPAASATTARGSGSRAATGAVTRSATRSGGGSGD